MTQSICVEVRGQFARVFLLLPCGTQGSNSGCHFWLKALLLTEMSDHPRNKYLKIM